MTNSDGRRSLIERFPLAVAGAVVSVLYFGLLLTITPVYETVDDSMLNGIVKGTWICPEPSAIMFYCNVALGWALSSLYRIQPGFPWYFAYELSAQYLAHLSMIWLFLSLRPGRGTVVLSCLYLIVVGEYALSHLSFTITAFLCGQSGFALLAWRLFRYSESRSTRLLQSTMAIGLIVLSSLIRFQVFELLAGISLPLLAFVVLQNKTAENDQRGLLLGGSTLGLVGSFYLLNLLVVNSTPGWKEFAEWNTETYRACDLTKPEVMKEHPTKAADVLESVGWSRNDLWMMKTWYLVDDQTYSLQRLRSFSDQWAQISVASHQQSLAKIGAALVKLMQERFCLACLLAALAVGIPRAGGRARCGMGMTWALIWGVMVWLAWGQKLPERVYAPLLLCGAVSTTLFQILSTKTDRQSISYRQLAAQCAVAILVLICSAGSIAEGARIRRDLLALKPGFLQDMEWLRHQNGRIFVMLNPFPWKFLTPADDLRELEGIRCMTSGCNFGSPHMDALAKSFGNPNLLESLQPGAPFLFGTTGAWRSQVLKVFVREHVRKNVDFRELYKSRTGWFTVYEAVNGQTDPRATQIANEGDEVRLQ